MGNGTAGGIGGEKREYTAEQISVVKRVRACKVTEYYEILSVHKTCEEGDVKKAYRKVRIYLWTPLKLTSLYSWHSLYIQTRMALLVLTKLLKVNHFLSNVPTY